MSDRDGNSEIYAVDPAGSGSRRLTRTPWDEMAPAWSPDRSRIAYVVSRGDSITDPSEIWTMDADGSDATLLLSGLGRDPADIAWAPDGAALAFSFQRQLRAVSAA